MSIINPRTITLQLDEDAGHHQLQINSPEEPDAAAAADITVISSDGDDADDDADDDPTGVISDEDEDEEEEEEEEEEGVTTTSSTTSTTTTSDSEENDIAILQRLLSDRLYKNLSYQERCEIENEIHGVQSMGLLPEQEAEQDDEETPAQGQHQKGYSNLVQTALEEFANHLEYALLLDDAMASTTVTDDDYTSTNNKRKKNITSAYEICLQRQYTYVTQYDSSLKLMCLRAGLWKNPQHSVSRFLNHLNLLYKYIVDLLTTTSQSSIQSHQQSSYNEFFQAIPIRFSAIHYCYYDQTPDLSNTNTTNKVIQSNTMLLLKSLVFCNDDSYSNNNSSSSSRIRFHYSNGYIGATDNATRSQLSTYGISVHEIPATSTGTIKVKQHLLWIKIQLWFDKKRKDHRDEGICIDLQEHHKHRPSNKRPIATTTTATTTTAAAAAAAAVIIECPNTNDVLFQQGGKFWNDNNKFQRGNLEYFDLIESKIINKYQQTGLSWKKSQILIDLINEYSAAATNSLGGGRFLEDASQSSSLFPAGTWIELPLDSPLLLKKVRSTLSNHIRRLENNNRSNQRKSKTNDNKRRRLLSPSSNVGNDNSSNTSNKKNKQKVIRKFTPQSEIIFDTIIANDERLNKEVDELFRFSPTE